MDTTARTANRGGGGGAYYKLPEYNKKGAHTKGMTNEQNQGIINKIAETVNDQDKIPTETNNCEE